MRNYRLFRVINFRFACAKNFKSFSANVQSIWDMHLIYNLLNQIISLNSKNWQNICWEDFATAFFETLTPTFANKYNLFVKFGLFIFAITYSRVNFWENLEKTRKNDWRNVLKLVKNDVKSWKLIRLLNIWGDQFKRVQFKWIESRHTCRIQS